ncbi:MAG: AtpZ/AtpI family protein [Agathobacter sp.]|nr:AtpZ/AtpI family protein [Agathobacter sp.]
MSKKNKKDDMRYVWDALIMVFQFGINMLVPIFICTFLGVWLGKKFDISWIVIPLFFVGAIAGGNNIYKMSKKFIDSQDKK